MVSHEHEHLILDARRQTELARAAARDLDGESVPGYRVERVMHRGGQGVVYRATQLSTDRVVALKILRDRPFRSAIDRARFEREVEVLGDLDHPNIVRIVDSGESDGRGYIAMDFVDGLALDRAAVADVRDRLRLFAAVCDAVHAAHLRGVIHRDLKPGNILVDAAGQPKVLDFGLARRFALEGDDLSSISTMTETGHFVGSLPWASPEQVSGTGASIDLRSDIYSLGVILYQLLTGQFPYRVTGPVRVIAEDIATAAPVPPSFIVREIGDELETIVLKTLSKEPDRRYQSAGDLARDIRRYLAGEVIEAKRDSIAYVLRKQLRRHWLPASAVAALVAVALGGAVITTMLWRSAVTQRDLKEAQRLRAESIRGVLHRILASANPERSAGESVTVAQVLDGAASELDAGSLEDIPDVESSIRLTLGEAYLALGRLDLAQRHLDQALSLAERVHGRRHEETALVLATLGRLQAQQSRDQEAADCLEEAMSIFEAAPLGPPPEAARAALTLATLQANLGQPERVKPLLDRAREITRAHFGAEHPETERVEIEIATHMLGSEHAVELLTRELALNRRALGPRHPETLRTLTQLAAELHVRGRVAESEEAYLQAIALGTAIHGTHHPDVLRLVTNLDWLYSHSGQPERREALLREWEPVARATFGPRSVRYAEYSMLLARAISPSHPDESVAALSSALDILQSIDMDQTWQGAECRVVLGSLLLRQHDSAATEAEPEVSADGAVARAPAPDGLADIERMAREVLAIEIREPQRMELRRAQAQRLLGEVLLRRGDFAEAETLLLQAHEALSGRRSLPTLRQATVRSLADLYRAWNAAEPDADRARESTRWRTELDASP